MGLSLVEDANKADATNAVQGEKIGNLNILAIMDYRVKTTCYVKLNAAVLITFVLIEYNHCYK